MGTNNGTIDQKMLDRLKQCSPAAISDTKHDGVATLSPSIAPVHSDCAFAGIARTVQLDPSALWAPVQTLDKALENDVIVVDTSDTTNEAVWGELLSTYAMTTGVKGVITDGAVRDIPDIRGLGFPVFAKEITPRGPSGSEEVEQNGTVSIAGVSVAPNDVLVGDETGIVVIKRDAVDEVLLSAEAIAETEQAVNDLIPDAKSLESAFGEAGM